MGKRGDTWSVISFMIFMTTISISPVMKDCNQASLILLVIVSNLETRKMWPQLRPEYTVREEVLKLPEMTKRFGQFLHMHELIFTDMTMQNPFKYIRIRLQTMAWSVCITIYAYQWSRSAHRLSYQNIYYLSFGYSWT